MTVSLVQHSSLHKSLHKNCNTDDKKQVHKYLLVDLQRALDHKGWQLEGRPFCNVSVCVNTKLRLKVGISSGQKVRGRKQTGRGEGGSLHVVSRESPSHHL